MLDLFLYETNELIDGLEEILLKTENTGFSEEDINEVFRSMHTIKGSSGMMGLDSISNLTHAAEDFFAFIRDNPNVEIDGGEVTDLILRVVDFIKHELNAMRNEDYEQGDARYLVEEIKEYTESVKEGKKQKTFKVHIYFDEGAQMENIRAFGVLNTIENMGEVASTEPADLDDEKSAEEIQANGFVFTIKTNADENRIRSILQDTMFLKSLQVTEVEKTSRKRKVNIDTTIISDSARNFVSVEVGKLDTLLDIVGELVIAESMLGRTDLGDEYEKAYNNLQRMTDELQNIVMSIRMVPVSGIFHKMQRVVRDLARKIGKDIDLVIKGEQTEVDKKIIDNLSEPLIHIIRNAVDHGIEDANERKTKGKDASGAILLEAYNEGGEVVIAVFDDGRGLDRNRIVEKALSLGLISTPEIPDNEVFNLITHPGFSTTENVTELSGRGVGMDVVYQEIKKAGGKLAIESRKDQGTAIIMRFPLTLAIIDGVSVSVGSEMYIIPALNVLEIFTMKDASLMVSGGRRMIRLRDELYPLVFLGEVFETKGYETDIYKSQLCLVNNDRGQICICVDRVLNKSKIVVKPIPEYLLTEFPLLKGFSACTIMGDGNIRLILDVNAFT